MLSACLLPLLMDRCPAHPFKLPPFLLFPPHRHFRAAEKWLRHVRSLRYREACGTVTPEDNLPDRSVILSPVPTENQKQILSSISHRKKKEKLSISAQLWQSSLHTTCDFLDRPCLTLAMERWRHASCPSLVSPALISSPLHLSCPSALCAQLNKQARGRFPLWKPWKMARTFSPRIWDLHLEKAPSLSLPPLSNLSVCSGEPMLQRWLSLSTGYNKIGPPGWLYSNRQPISIK